jgi:purine catabolism regulator
VRSVVAMSGLHLRRVAGPDGHDRPVRWVAVSELEDPTPFLDGGELLLSTGMRLPAAGAEAFDAFVRRLVEAEVAAFGLGIGLTHEAMPTDLVAAADRHGLPLLEVPATTAFISVSKAVSAALGVEELEAITRAFEAQRDLTRAALAPDGSAVVAARLARHIAGWTLVLDGSGEVLHAAPGDMRARAAEVAGGLHDEVEALRGRGLLASSSVGDADGSVGLHPLGARGKVRGFLAVGTPRPLDRTAQSVVAVAVSLLSLAVEQDGPVTDGPGAVRAATVRLLLAGADPADLPLDAIGWQWLRTGPLRVLVVGGSAEQLSSCLRALEPDGATSRAVALDGDHLLVVVRDDPEQVAALATALGALRAGGSGPVPVADLALGRRQAAQALAGGRTPGLHWYGQLAADGMLAALDTDAARGVADALLAPLEGRKGDLVRSLASWLGHHGQWDTAAAELGVHRHTLRYRMRRVEELLGRSLDDPDLRAELWLALRVRGAVLPEPAGSGGPSRS